MIMGPLDLRGTISLTGQGDRGNLVAFNGGADEVTNSLQIIRNHFRRDFAGEAVFCVLITFASWKPDPKTLPSS